MQSPYHIPDPGPETEAQKERAKYLGLMVQRARERRKERWNRSLRTVTRLLHK